MISAILTIGVIILAFYIGFKVGIYCGAKGQKLKEVLENQNSK